MTVQPVPDLGSKTTYNVHEAKTHFSELLARVERGERITIARAGNPVVQLVAIAPARRQFGFLDLPEIPDEFFFDPLTEEELAAWE